MSSIPFPSVRFDKLRNAYGVLAVFFVAVEIVLVVWLLQASSTIERSLAGGAMVVLFLTALISIVIINNRMNRPSSVVRAPMLGEIPVATEYATTEEISAPSNEKFVGPDRSYDIDRPPKDWRILEFTTSAYIRYSLRIPADNELPSKFAQDYDIPGIVIFKSPLEYSYSPYPGRTRVHGRKVPSALQVTIPMALTIIPMPRIRPPLFRSQTFDQNFFTEIAAFLKLPMMLEEIRPGIIPGTQYKRWDARFRQVSEAVAVQGVSDTSITVHLIAIGIEGQINDHALLLQYPEFPQSSHPELQETYKALQRLAKSFRPLSLQPEEAQQQMRELERSGDREFRKFITTQGLGKAIFDGEFSIVKSRLEDLDFNSKEDLTKVVEVLTPFKALAQMVHYEDPTLDRLWVALQDVKGDQAGELQAALTNVLKRTDKGEVDNDQGIEKTAEVRNRKVRPNSRTGPGSGRP